MGNDKSDYGLDVNKEAFTIIELLVVVAIIGLLLAMLTPALKIFKIQADSLKQKSVFHGMDTAIELFRKDYNGYPDSDVLPAVGGADLVCGAQRVAEALLGRDQRGFDPKSTWYAPTDLADTAIYASTAKGSSQQEIDASLNRRKRPYMELKKDTGLYTLNSFYTTTGNLYAPDPPVDAAPVLTDVFFKKTILIGNKVKVGSPILYFKAEPTSRFFGDLTTQPDTSKWIYDYEDNKPIFELAVLPEEIERHHFNQAYTDPDDASKDGRDLFYEAMTNPAVVNFKKPVNSTTFILWSAGYDATFGTKDDITNFDY